MRSPANRRPTPPTTAADLLGLLRRARLLEAPQLARLAAAWLPPDDPGQRLRELVDAGVLTPYQAARLRRGRTSRLRIGPYLLLARLGSGGSSKVYKAEHVLMKRTVALKVLNRAEQPPAEAQTAARLTHPNIVAVHDATYHHGRLVVVMEFADGTDLERVVRKGGPLPVPLVCEVARQTTLALEYLHHHGLVHRDVKPANLMLTADASGAPRVKLLDLGLTCGVGDREVCGTLDYIAPERGMGQPADPRGDLYSLGCTLYHLLTGRVPFPGSDGPGKLLRHRLEEPVPIRQVRPEVPEPLAGLVAALMEPIPERRLADPAVVREQLLPTRPPAPRPRRPRRSWVPVLLAAVALGLVFGGSVRLATNHPAAQGHSPAASPPVERPAPFDLAAAIAAVADGGTLTLSSDGPFRLRPVTLGGRRLTIEAAPGSRPVIERERGDDAAWEPLFSTEGELTLTGLVLKGDGPAPLIAVRGGRMLRLSGCELWAAGQAVSFEAATGGEVRLAVRDSTVRVADRRGAAVVVWRAEPGPSARVEVELTGSAVAAGRVLACRSLDGPVVVSERDCRLHWKEARHSLDGYAASPPAVLRWEASRGPEPPEETSTR